MADLEDAFLKQNVPGRYSSWTDAKDGDRQCDVDDNDGGGDGDESSDDDEHYFRDLPATQKTGPPPPPPSTLMRSKGNTGVKGVLADYREAQQLERLRREEDRLDSMRALQRATRPAVAAPSAPVPAGGKGDGGARDDSDSCDDDEDDEFLKKFRSQRLAELRETRGVSTEPPPPTFGSLERLSPEEYVDLVDAIDPRVFLVVHLRDDSVPHCRMLHSVLERVAQCTDSVRFVEVEAVEANPNLDTICLPAVLVYREGELVHNIVRFTDDLPRDFGVEDVRTALEGLLGV